MDNIEKVKEYMNSVKELVFKLRGQEIKVDILSFDIRDGNDGAELIYKYQLA